MSGIVLTPRGKPPRGGWPLVTWGHGTAGSADRCAPSRASINQSEYGKEVLGPLWTGYLKAGYALAQTDYEGLGSPGHHPFLIGRSEARGMLDIARAARAVDGRVGRRVLVAGHSQGGHSALWTAGEIARWTPELKLLGTQAFAPIGKASPLAAAREALTAPGGLSAYAALLTRAIDTVVPDFDAGAFLTEPALDLYPQTTSRCIGELYESFAGISVADMFRDDADGERLVNLVETRVDVNQLKLRRGLLLLHGTEDQTVPVGLSDALVEEMREAGTRVAYKRYEGANHTDVVVRARRAALADARRRLR